MKREFYNKLISWKSSNRRKPLIVRGARQVGKTYILKEFAKEEYSDYIYLNFDQEKHFEKFFEENLDPERIIKELSIYFKKTINPSTTLIIFDEIQECSNALNSLKYFCEDSPDYHIATAGSLLGVKLTKGFPVGKVNFLDLGPMNFFEFLDANGESRYRKLLEDMPKKAISEVFHDKLVKLLKYYFVIGGMPEAVASYLKKGDLHQVRIVQQEILDAYILDFAKHAPKEDVMKIMAIWQSIPNQLAKENKKFVFAAISKSARAREYETSIQWLIDAGLILKACNISAPKLPLSAYSDSRSFKVFLLDIGLLGAMSNLDPRALLDGNKLFQEFKGSLTENFVATELHHNHFKELYYWSDESRAEVDFVINFEGDVFPLEVKAGFSRNKKSLIVYKNKFCADRKCALSRASLYNFAFEDSIVNYPLYASCLFPKLNEC